MGLTEALEGQRIFIDTNIVIYAAEVRYKDADPTLKPVIAAVRRLFAALANNRLVLVTSELTLSEVLTGALKAGKPRLANYYSRALSDEGIIEMVAVNRKIWKQVAHLRAKSGSGLKTPDAIQIACAIESQCNSIVCNDRKVAVMASKMPGITGIYTGDLMND